MSEWFRELSEQRRRWVTSTRENKFERGIWQSTVDKYSNPVHFVYELLQNAEDQGADFAAFVLKSNGLLFEHNGAPFSRRDVENITGLGNSEKPQQANKIGRFGIGFKSVFAVTERPRIETFLDGQPFGFAIEDLVVPVLEPSPALDPQKGRTRIKLPFPPHREGPLREQIAAKLRALGADALLFLDRLTKVMWRVGAEEVTLRCLRPEGTAPRGRLPEGGVECRLREEVRRDGQTISVSDTVYRVYAKEVSFADADRPLTTRIAFRMDGGRMVPEPGLGTASVFFPTKEKTGLKFRLHAPFLLNDSRANIKESHPVNTRLIESCAELLAGALPDLRDRGLLTPEALACLPLREDDFPERLVLSGTVTREGSPFRPLFDATRAAFRTQELLPTAAGSSRRHVRAVYARVSDSKPLRELLGEAQLTALYGLPASTPACWLSDRIGKNADREVWDYLIKTLEVEDVDSDKVARRVEGTFLEAQSDEWMARFYEFLNDQPALWRARGLYQAGPLRGKPLIRIEPDTADTLRGSARASTNQVVPFLSDGVTPNVYLGGGEAGFRTVKATILASDEAVRFLRSLGLRPPDVTDWVLRTILPHYTALGDADFDDAEYSKHLDLIGQSLAASDPSDRGRLDRALMNTPFVYAVNAADPARVRWKRPADVVLPTEEMETWFAGNPDVWFPHEEASTHPRWEEIVGFLNRFRTVLPETPRVKTRGPGSDNHIELVNRRGAHERGLNRFDPNATIDGLDHALAHMTLAKAHLLWYLLLANVDSIQGTVEASTHSSFVNPTRTQRWSHLGERVRSHAWVPDELSAWEGPFRSPHQIALAELPAYLREVANARELAVALEMSRPVEEDVADKLGVSAESLTRMINLLRRNPAILEQLDALPAPAEFPEAAVPNPERRAARVGEQMQDAPPTAFERRLRSVRVSADGVHEDRRAYLSAYYQNADGETICQICCRPMPFCLDDGRDYFEAVACFRGFPQEHYQNALALCPVCAAKFHHALGTPPDQLREALLSADGLTVPLVLVRQQATLRFVEPHLLDLQTILRAYGDDLEGPLEDT